jgi:Fur family ferric uptake transcriptional regulator
VCKSTDSGAWHELEPAELEQLGDALHERGLHLTGQREAVWAVVCGCPGHICAEHVLAAVEARSPVLGMNKTTVYRTLSLLVELGLVSEHRCGEGPAQYEPASRGRHSHVMCRRCGTLFNLDEELAETLRAGLASRHGFLAELESYPVFGLCASCQR